MEVRAAAGLSAAALLLAAGACAAQTAAVLPPVRVQGERSTAESLLGARADAPVGVRIVGPEELAKPGVRSVSSALQGDPAVGENYAITGYYENFTIRGFPLDLGSSYRVNGLIVPGEVHIALDNKDAIEVLRGSGNLAGGLVGPGGTINFLSARPANASAARLEWGERGGTYAAADVGRAGAARGIGWRVHVAHEESRPAEQRANGHRDFASLALDLQPVPAWKLAFDAEYGRRAQPAVPGFQLLAGERLPNVDPRTNINQQPWSRPVRNESSLVSVRSTHELAPALRLRWALGDAQARIDDSLAFPFGCNAPPLHYFCADGSYVLYDYRALERRRTTHALLSLEGLAKQGGATHEWRAGLERVRRSVRQHQLHSTTLYDAESAALSGNLATVATPLPAPPTDGMDLPDRRAVQRAAFVADHMAWGRWHADAGSRFVRIAQQPAGEAVSRALPQFALAWHGWESGLLFANVARGLDFGSEAPVAAQNVGALLPPRRTRQLEVGGRYRASADTEVSLTAFRMSKPFQFTESSGASWAGLGDHVQRGTQVHRGAELTARTALTREVESGVEAAAIRAVARGTREPAFEGKQVQNVPRWRHTAWAAFAPHAVPGLRLELRWTHVGERSARADGLAKVPGYERFDANASWDLRPAGAARLKLQAAVENLGNRRYWRDAGFAYGADLLFPGRPRTVTFGLLAQLP